jgi:predicted ATPase
MKEIFCGREAEIRWLEDKYKRAMSGEFSVIFVSGEAGSGKTFLIEEFLRRKEEEDKEIVVAIGRCSDLNQKVPDPYAPFKQIGYFISGKSEKAGVYVLSQYSRERVEKINKKVLEIAKEVGGEILGALIPPLQVVKTGWNIFKILRGRERVEKSEDSIRVAYTLFLKRLSEIKPIVLFIDDLHWADDGSINLLFHLARNMDKDRLTIFVAYREEELSEEGRRCVSELSGRYGCPVLRFGREGWEEFVREYLKKNYPDIRIKGDALKELIDRTQGNPFFLSQIMLELKDKGLIRDGEIDMGDMRRVPERVGDFLYERYQRLEEDLKRILRIGSVEGNEFTLQVVSRVLSMPEERLVEVIGERLIRGYGFLNEAGEKRLKRILELYRFRHAYLRDTIYERGLTEGEKRRLHRLVGEALEAVLGEDDIDFLPQLYQHFLIAGMPDKVIDYVLKLAPI